MRKFKVSRPVVYILLFAVVVGAYVFLSDENVRRGTAKRKTTNSATTNLPEGFTAEDLSASFEPVAERPRNAFNPLVIRSDAGSATASSPDAVPSVLTGGDPNWFYTGMAEIDGVPMGLLENRVTGEGVFLKHSEHWKQATVTAISPFSMILVGSNGKSYTLSVNVEGNTASNMLAGGFQPVNPPLRGAIANDRVEVTPERVANRNPNRGNSGSTTNEARDGEQN